MLFTNQRLDFLTDLFPPNSTDKIWYLCCHYTSVPHGPLIVSSLIRPR